MECVSKRDREIAVSRELWGEQLTNYWQYAIVALFALSNYCCSACSFFLVVIVVVIINIVVVIVVIVVVVVVTVVN